MAKFLGGFRRLLCGFCVSDLATLPLTIFESRLLSLNKAEDKGQHSGDYSYYSGHIWSAITCKWCKIGGKLVLSTNRKSYLGFWLVLKSVTLNGIMAIILRYFAKFSSFRGQLRKSDWLAINRFSPKKCHKVHQLRTTDALCSLR